MYIDLKKCQQGLLTSALSSKKGISNLSDISPGLAGLINNNNQHIFGNYTQSQHKMEHLLNCVCDG